MLHCSVNIRQRRTSCTQEQAYCYSRAVRSESSGRHSKEPLSLVSELLLLNGPNLNRLGSREPEVYGRATLADIEAGLTAEAAALGHRLHCFQSNHEGALVERIHQAADEGVACAIFNPGAYTHTSIALRDALLAVALPFVEVHLSNVFARESFRHRSYLSDIAIGVICGLGAQGYSLALSAANQWLNRKLS